MRLYAVKDENTGKLVSNITNPRKKYWDRKSAAEEAVRRAKRRVWDDRALKVITYELVEVSDEPRVCPLCGFRGEIDVCPICGAAMKAGERDE